MVYNKVFSSISLESKQNIGHKGASNGKYKGIDNFPSDIQACNRSEPFSLISNKIHLKNLQMKVGNSIRKTEKLKKIYEGSISSLSVKFHLI